MPRPNQGLLPNTSWSEPQTSHAYQEYTTSTSGALTSGRNTGRPSTGRPKTSVSGLGRSEAHQVICAVSESRGISPTVGLAFLNLDTGEAVLCQISDSQTYVRTLHKLQVHAPSQILIFSTASNPKSKLFSIVDENLDVLDSTIVLLDRRYWAETTGLEYIQRLTLVEDVEAIKMSVEGNYFAVCCIAAVFKYVELALGKTFLFHSLRIKYEPSEGAMMIDVSTIHSLELVQNLQNPKSRHCLFGLLNTTLTPMGSRLLRSNILQPLTDIDTLTTRLDSVEELTTKEEIFFAIRQALKGFLDVDKVLTAFIVVPKEPSIQFIENTVNRIVMLKQFVISIVPIHEALTGTTSAMLTSIREVVGFIPFYDVAYALQMCAPENVVPIQEIIDAVINEDTVYASRPLELRNQRTYAIKSGVHGMLDVQRQTYNESVQDAYQHVEELSNSHSLQLEMKFDNVRKFYIRFPASELEGRQLPPEFTNVFRNKNKVECQTLDLMKLNERITHAHNRVMEESNDAAQKLTASVVNYVSTLLKISEGIAMLDLLAAFAQLATTRDYVRPHFTDTLAIQSGRHPIKETFSQAIFVPNDVYATQQSRFQIITGCNMSGKSTYIRSIALMAVMAQVGSFVPADYASFPILLQLFARVSGDDNTEANISTFAAEMREMAFILRNIDQRTLALIDELGRGTSTQDGLAIAIAVAEALVDSKALVWFATHFRDLAKVMAECNGVINLHMAVDMANQTAINMLYKIEEGAVQEAHYGLALARVVPLPAGVVERASTVALALEQRNKQRRENSEAVMRRRRRNLLLNLREQLIQTQRGTLEGETLSSWLQELQREFIVRMSAIMESRQSLEGSEGSG